MGAKLSAKEKLMRAEVAPISRKHLSMPELINVRRLDRMKFVDALPQELRELVHEYGLSVVRSIMDSGVTRPKNIRHIVETVLDEFSPTRGTCSAQGQRPAKGMDPDKNISPET